jgi:hypothetical protein
VKTKLDTRAARCDLTSRECCKLICGALGGALGAGVEQEVLRQMLKIVSLVQFEDAVTSMSDAAEAIAMMKQRETVAAGTSGTMMMFGAILGAINEQAAPGSMRDACRWILQQEDDFWQALRAPMDAAAQTVAGQSS